MEPRCFLFLDGRELSDEDGDELPLPNDPTNNALIKATGAKKLSFDGIVDLSLLEEALSLKLKAISSRCFS